LLEDPAFHEKAAQAIAQGIADCFEFKLIEEWDPAIEIRKLIEKGLITNEHKPGDAVTWGQLATVINRMDRMEG